MTVGVGASVGKSTLVLCEVLRVAAGPLRGSDSGSFTRPKLTIDPAKSDVVKSPSNREGRW
jgi:hypothetical protein